MRLTCNNKKCKYTWEYRGHQKFYATCPRCLYKVSVQNLNDNKEV